MNLPMTVRTVVQRNLCQTVAKGLGSQTTMQKSQRRLKMVYGHIMNNSTHFCNVSADKPTITLQPTTCLVDEQIHISVSGLIADQVVTLTSHVEEGGSKFEARAVYKASKSGTVDNKWDPSLAGTYTGVEPMGLFWSLKPSPGQGQWIRLVKKNVESPMVFTINIFDGSHVDDVEIQLAPLTSAIVNRLYKCPSVRRIPVKKGLYRGTIFIPEGPGPFAGVIDCYGGLVSLVETRAALLASRGYAVFALSYLYQAHLAQMLVDADPNYIKAAAEWFSQQDYVDEERLGCLGLCYGGFMLLNCAAICPKVKAVVNINGTPFIQAKLAHTIKTDRVTEDFESFWGMDRYIYVTEEGIVVSEGFNCEASCIPAWQHGAKILTIVGEDDKQVNPMWHSYSYKHCPDRYRGNVEMVRYLGAGHLIEPPYSPLCRVVNPGRARLATVNILSEELRDLKMVAGGYTQQHAKAQEDSWRRILDFLKKNLKDLPTNKNVRQTVHVKEGSS